MRYADDSWMARAACHRSERDGVTFFSSGTPGGGATPQMYRERSIALSYCAVCPVRSDCLEYALTTNQEYGIWGGETENARKRIRKRRRLSALMKAS